MFTSLTKLTTLFKAKLKWWELGEHEIFKSSLLLNKLSSCRIHFSFKYTLKSLLLVFSYLSLSSCVLPCRHTHCCIWFIFCFVSNNYVFKSESSIFQIFLRKDLLWQYLVSTALLWLNQALTPYFWQQVWFKQIAADHTYLQGDTDKK